MLKREVAKRVFAREFEAFKELEKSVISDSKVADSKTSKLLISPLGLILNRVFIVGVITELDSVDTQKKVESKDSRSHRSFYSICREVSALKNLFSFRQSKFQL